MSSIDTQQIVIKFLIYRFRNHADVKISRLSAKKSSKMSSAISTRRTVRRASDQIWLRVPSDTKKKSAQVQAVNFHCSMKNCVKLLIHIRLQMIGRMKVARSRRRRVSSERWRKFKFRRRLRRSCRRRDTATTHRATFSRKNRRATTKACKSSKRSTRSSRTGHAKTTNRLRSS